MSEYTPSTNHVRDSYEILNSEEGSGGFDRWLAAVKATAWTEGYDAAGYLGDGLDSNPYRGERA